MNILVPIWSRAISRIHGHNVDGECLWAGRGRREAERDALRQARASRVFNPLSEILQSSVDWVHAFCFTSMTHASSQLAGITETQLRRSSQPVHLNGSTTNGTVPASNGKPKKTTHCMHRSLRRRGRASGFEFIIRTQWNKNERPFYSKIHFL